MWIAHKSLFTGLLIACAEIFIGGHGHLISAPILGFPLSLRITIFLAIMVVWMIHILRKKMHLSYKHLPLYPWILLILALILGGITGLAYGNNPLFIFDDANGYLILGYALPFISIEWTEARRATLLRILTAAALWVSVGTLILSYIFTHSIESYARPLYTFIRDTRLAEITLQSVSNSEGIVTHPFAAYILGESGYWYRIFMQSQFFVIALTFFLITYTVLHTEKIRILSSTSLLIIFSIATIFLSQSRSFFVGLCIALTVISGFIFYLKRKEFITLIKQYIYLIGMSSIALLLVWISITLPIPTKPSVDTVLFSNTSIDTDRYAAVSSRWSLLSPMMIAIDNRPILGSGFGTVLTYKSDDPRIYDETGSTALTTYRFEWGYHDIWIKMGLIGLVAYGSYLYMLFRASVTMWNHTPHWIILGFVGTTLTLFVTHIFSPYLNHPIGLIWLLSIIPFIYTTRSHTMV